MKYYKVTGLNEGRKIKPIYYACDDKNDLMSLISIPEWMDATRDYKEISEKEYNAHMNRKGSIVLNRAETLELEEHGYVITERKGFDIVVEKDDEMPGGYAINIVNPYEKIKKTY